MPRVFSFSAGPAVLPELVLRQAADGMLDRPDSGMFLVEMSHRGKELIAIHEGVHALVACLRAFEAEHG